MRLEVAEFLHQVKGSIRIPKGTKPFPCRGGTCENRRVYMVRAEKEGGAPRPVSIEPYGLRTGIAPTEEEDGAGISHFADCPGASQFHRTRRNNG